MERVYQMNNDIAAGIQSRMFRLEQKSETFRQVVFCLMPKSWIAGWKNFDM